MLELKSLKMDLNSGIIDATKVFRTAFENAMSVASVIHLSGYSVYQEVMK